MDTTMGLITVINVASAEAVGGPPPSLLDFTPTFVLVAINLLVLYFVLKKLLFTKFTAFMDKRATMIQESLEESQKAREFAETTQKEYAQKMRDSKAEVVKMLEEAKADTSKQSDELMKLAKVEAENLIVKAREEIERERDKMIKEVRSEVASLALAAASKVIEANLDTESNRRLVEKFIDEAGAA